MILVIIVNKLDIVYLASKIIKLYDDTFEQRNELQYGERGFGRYMNLTKDKLLIFSDYKNGRLYIYSIDSIE